MIFKDLKTEKNLDLNTEQKNQTINTNFIYNKIVGFFIKEGNKINAKDIVDWSFSELSKTTKKPIHLILIKIFLKFNNFVEVKKIKSRRNSHIIPFPINFKRKIYLILRWIMSSIKEDKRKISTKKKFFFELLSIYTNKKAKSLIKNNLNKTGAFKNKSNAHFRW
jgi:ribosomal protein S7